MYNCRNSVIALCANSGIRFDTLVQIKPDAIQQQEVTLDIFNTREAADYVRLGPPTLERFRISGYGPRYCKLGGAVRYRQADLDDWLESRLVRSTSEECVQ